jgi:hypothetical protein
VLLHPAAGLLPFVRHGEPIIAFRFLVDETGFDQ